MKLLVYVWRFILASEAGAALLSSNSHCVQVASLKFLLMEMFLNGKEEVVIKCDVAAENLQFVGNVLCCYFMEWFVNLCLTIAGCWLVDEP